MAAWFTRCVNVLLVYFSMKIPLNQPAVCKLSTNGLALKQAQRFRMGFAHIPSYGCAWAREFHLHRGRTEARITLSFPYHSLKDFHLPWGGYSMMAAGWLILFIEVSALSTACYLWKPLFNYVTHSLSSGRIFKWMNSLAFHLSVTKTGPNRGSWALTASLETPIYY